MTSPRAIELPLAQALALVQRKVLDAQSALHANDLETALDCLITASGLALQLGPAATEKLLSEIVASARELAQCSDAAALCALGPALVGLIQQMEEADVLPSTHVMHAWADIVSDLGALIGQLGLTLTLHREHRAGMMRNAHARASLLDDATGHVFGLTCWIEQLSRDPEEH